MKLLIVDDSSVMRQRIMDIYQGSVFTEIRTAGDGVEAVRTYEEFRPDIVTLDITMPHLDGLSALTQMLEIEHTDVLIVSALADNHTAIESLIRGAHQFICKPFTEDDLREALDNIVKGNETANEKSNKRVTEQMRLSKPETSKTEAPVPFPSSPPVTTQSSLSTEK